MAHLIRQAARFVFGGTLTFRNGDAHLFSYSRYSAFVHLSLATVDPWLDLDSTGTWLSSQQRACSEKGSNWSFF